MDTSTLHPEQIEDVGSSPEDRADLLFLEARRRARRRRIGYSSILLVAIALFVVTYGGGGSKGRPLVAGHGSRPSALAGDKSLGVLSCIGTSQFKPSKFVISCADANALLTDTKWGTWTAKAATGVSKFGLNLCNPNCAASKISYFPNSPVTLSDPVKTSHGALYSKLSVRYKLAGKLKTFTFNWNGDPSFGAK